MSRNGIRGIAFFAAAAILLAACPVFVADVRATEAQPGAEQAIETMIKAIKEDNAPIRNRMFFRLRDIGEPSVDPLIAAYAANSELPVRQYIINMLGWVGGEKSYQFISGKITDQRAEIRQKAAEALCTIDDKRGIPLLIQALDDSDENVRIAAIVSLGVLEDPRAIKPLKKKLDDPSPRVAKFAENYLELLAITYPEAETGGGK
jgi:HEAT repeat protein